jgi:ferredoxin-NADP reductase
MPQRQAAPAPHPGFLPSVEGWPLVHGENGRTEFPTVIAPPVHPPNLPATPGAGVSAAPHEALLVPAPAGPPIIALAGQNEPPTMHDLRILLAGDPGIRREQAGQALSWLLEYLDRPQVVAAGCADLGPALQQLGASAQRLDAMGVLVADALRANVGAGWRQEHYDAWHSSARLVTRWMGEGMERVDYEPAFWTATVVAHERRGADTALLSVRTYLPYPFLPGQVATVESGRHPQMWRPFWIAGLPHDDNTVLIEVRARDEVADALVNRTAVGDRVRLRPARGGLSVDHGSDRDVLLIAHDTGITPIRVVLAALRRHRGVHLLWNVDAGYPDGEEFPDVTVVRVDGPEQMKRAVDEGDWRDADVYVSGTPDEVRGTLAILAEARVPADHVHAAPLE